MHRRAFVIGMAALAAASPAVGQPRRIPRVGVMISQPLPNSFTTAFAAAIRQYGYVEGQSIHIEYRSVDGALERFPAVAAEFVRMSVDVIVAGGTAATRAAKVATGTIPIVFPGVTDPVAEGFVQSLARPGGNATGFSLVESEINRKRIQIVKELLPRVRRVALLVHSAEMTTVDLQVRATEEAARAFGIELVVLKAATQEEIRVAVSAARKANAEAFIAAASAYFATHRKMLVELAAQNKLVALWQHRQFTDAGGLISYGPDFAELYRGAARYVDRILKGAKPADLPVEQATKFELVVNMKTAKAQNVAIPASLRVRADHVIE